MLFPFYISKRFALSKRDSKWLNFISTIAIIGIALGSAALIIALNIIAGFEKTIVTKIIDFDSHIQLQSIAYDNLGYQIKIDRFKKILEGTEEEISPYTANLAIIGNRNYKDGITVKGVLPNKQNNTIRKNIKEGSYNLTSDSSIIIGKKLALKLFVKVGDRLTLFALKNNEMPSLTNLPNIKKYVITAIYESGMSEYDDLFCYVNLSSAQTLFSLPNAITGYDIKLKEPSKIEFYTNKLLDVFGREFYIRNLYTTHENIFTWIELQKKPIPIILGLIIIVAVFNIISTLLMLILEKTSAVGILRSLGLNRKNLMIIFLIQGGFITLAGIILGNLLGFILCYIQLEYSIISIPSSVYFMSTIPVQINAINFVIISCITLILGIIASIVPSYIASKMSTIKSLRFG